MREATVGSDRMRRAGVWNEGKDERVMCHFLFSNTINHIRSTRSSFPTLATLVPLASLVWYEWSEGRMTEPVSDTRDRSEVAHGGWAWHRETDHAQPSYVHHEPPHPYPHVPSVRSYVRSGLRNHTDGGRVGKGVWMSHDHNLRPAVGDPIRLHRRSFLSPSRSRWLDASKKRIFIYNFLI